MISDKMEYLNFCRSQDEHGSNFTITDKKGNILKQKGTIKILGYTVNKNNDMESHMSAMVSKINYSYNKIRGAMPYLRDKENKIIIESKLNAN